MSKKYLIELNDTTVNKLKEILEYYKEEMKYGRVTETSIIKYVVEMEIANSYRHIKGA